MRPKAIIDPAAMIKKVNSKQILPLQAGLACRRAKWSETPPYIRPKAIGPMTATRIRRQVHRVSGMS